jgi:hypothetical protein
LGSIGVSAAVHDPEATALTCAACRAGALGFDHEAVRGARPKDFEEQMRAHVTVIARGGSVAGLALRPDAARRAQRWLRAHPGRS